MQEKLTYNQIFNEMVNRLKVLASDNKKLLVERDLYKSKYYELLNNRPKNEDPTK